MCLYFLHVSRGLETATGEQVGGQSSQGEGVGHLQPEKIVSSIEALESSRELTEAREAREKQKKK